MANKIEQRFYSEIESIYISVDHAGGKKIQ